MAVKVMDVGRVCYKTLGRNAGEKIVIVGSAKGNDVIVKGEGKLLQKCNIRHLFPTKETVKVKEVSEKELEERKKAVKKKEKKTEEGKVEKEEKKKK